MTMTDINSLIQIYEASKGELSEVPSFIEGYSLRRLGIINSKGAVEGGYKPASNFYAALEIMENFGDEIFKLLKLSGKTLNSVLPKSSPDSWGEVACAAVTAAAEIVAHDFYDEYKTFVDSQEGFVLPFVKAYVGHYGGGDLYSNYYNVTLAQDKGHAILRGNYEDFVNKPFLKEMLVTDDDLKYSFDLYLNQDFLERLKGTQDELERRIVASKRLAQMFLDI